MDLKELYSIAKNTLKEVIYSDNPDFRLEQAEYDNENGIWEIVVSFLVENSNKSTNPLFAINQNLPYERVYKTFKINQEKKVVGFYIYNPSK